MHLTTLSSWATLLIVFTLVILLLWITHDVLHRGPRNAAHRHEQYDGLEVFDD